MTPGPLVATFSIVGHDPAEPAWGIAIASRFLAVGARTCWGAPDAVVARLQAGLAALGYYDGPASGTLDAPTREAMRRLAYHHNLRQRMPQDAAWVDRRVLAYVEARAATAEARAVDRAGRTAGSGGPA